MQGNGNYHYNNDVIECQPAFWHRPPFKSYFGFPKNAILNRGSFCICPIENLFQVYQNDKAFFEPFDCVTDAIKYVDSFIEELEELARAINNECVSNVAWECTSALDGWRLDGPYSAAFFVDGNPVDARDFETPMIHGIKDPRHALLVCLLKWKDPIGDVKI